MESVNNLSRRSSSISSMYGGYHNSLHHISQLFLNYPNTNISQYPLSLHPPLSYSLPPSPQPPLLPLPLKSATLPSTTRKIGIAHSPSKYNNNNTNSQKNRRQKKKKKKENKKQMRPIIISTTTSPPPPLPHPKREVTEPEEEETEEEFLIVPSSSSSLSVGSKSSVNYYYSASPPPSSLPIPRLLLMRLRPPEKSTCVAEAMADSGEADDFCRLLRL